MALEPALDRLAAAWDALPPDVRERAASGLSIACAVMAEAITILGTHGQALLGPAVNVGVQAFQAVLIWQQPFDGPGGVAAKIEARFPSAITLLKALMPDEVPPPAAPPPDAA